MDNNGLIVHWNNGQIDGGDSLNRSAHYAFCRSFNGPEEKRAAQFWLINKLGFYRVPNSYGYYVRHPDPRWAYYEPSLFKLAYQMLKNPEGQAKWSCGRDQLKPLEITLRRLELDYELADYEHAMSSRCQRYQNLDWRYPFKEASLRFMAMSLVTRLNKNSDDVGDALNFIQELIYISSIGQISLAKWCIDYFKNNSKIDNPFQYCLDWYFRHDEAPPINELYRPLITKFLNP